MGLSREGRGGDVAPDPLACIEVVQPRRSAERVAGEREPVRLLHGLR
jgi:hypothetical protein